MRFKQFFRKTLNLLHLDVTKNLEYDRLTKLVLKKSLSENSNCIDVGCHKGEILDEILRLAPKGKHLAFEPIPTFYEALKAKYQLAAKIYPYALSDSKGNATFNYVRNAPAYSGLKQRDYAVDTPEIEKIEVTMIPLDDLISQDALPHFIKIDVEGGEFGVLKGAEQTLKTAKPIILFECGLGASEHYGTTPNELFDFLNELSYGVYVLKDYLSNKTALSKEAFIQLYTTNSEYYFVAK
jgi:FkbM family methyltransferase